MVRLFPMLVVSSDRSQGHFCGELMNAACRCAFEGPDGLIFPVGHPIGFAELEISLGRGSIAQNVNRVFVAPDLDEILSKRRNQLCL